MQWPKPAESLAWADDRKRGTRRRCRRVVRSRSSSGEDVFTVEHGQAIVPLPPHFELEKAPLDGNCFFPCVRWMRPEISVQELRRIAGKDPDGHDWAGEADIAAIAGALGLRITFWPVDLLSVSTGSVHSSVCGNLTTELPPQWRPRRNKEQGAEETDLRLILGKHCGGAVFSACPCD